jgi:hypothetical protein
MQSHVRVMGLDDGIQHSYTPAKRVEAYVRCLQGD